MSTRTWSSLLTIDEASHRELTLEVLATFMLTSQFRSWDWVSLIKFQLYSALHRMSYTGFAFRLSLYNLNFTKTEEY